MFNVHAVWDHAGVEASRASPATWCARAAYKSWHRPEHLHHLTRAQSQAASYVAFHSKTNTDNQLGAYLGIRARTEQKFVADCDRVGHSLALGLYGFETV